METSARFQNAIQALVDGYLNDTLVKGACAACAVGNICARSTGTKVSKRIIGVGYKWENDDTRWQDVFVTNSSGYQLIWPDRYVGLTKLQIDATLYSWEDLSKIEYTFETNTIIHFMDYRLHTPEEIDADQYAGLMAVVDTLCEIEGIGDATEYKALFAKA